MDAGHELDLAEADEIRQVGVPTRKLGDLERLCEVEPCRIAPSARCARSHASTRGQSSCSQARTARASDCIEIPKRCPFVPGQFVVNQLRPGPLQLSCVSWTSSFRRKCINCSRVSTHS